MKETIMPAAKAARGQFVSENLTAGQNNPLSQTPRRPALTNGLVVHFSKPFELDDDGNFVKHNMQKDQVTNQDGTLGPVFYGYPTAEEILVTTGQIARKGNGLGLQGATVDDMLDDFEQKVAEAWEKNAAVKGYKGPAVQVTELRTRPSRTGIQVTPVFNVTW